jgi:glycosyltransferase involved in cell wall biosynthesis
VKVIIVTEAVLHGESSSPVYGPDGLDRELLSPYLEVFEEVLVVARHLRQPARPSDKQLDKDGVEVLALPMYQGVGGYLSTLRALARAIRPLRRVPAAIVLRVPSPLASVVQTLTWSYGRPYAVEVVGDVWDVLAPGVVDGPGRPLLRLLGTLETKRLCYWATGAAYVTRERLQRRYPVRVRKRRDEWPLSTQYSQVSLPEGATGSPAGPPNATVNRLLFVGSLAQRYKGLDTLLHAVAMARDQGRSWSLRVIGEGKYRPEMEILARRLGIVDQVSFLGTMSRAEVSQEMAAAALFVLPSRTEGLPRVLLEAMAVGTPCVATAVGGIPELLPPEALIRPNDPAGLAELIERLLGSPELRRRLIELGDAVLGDFRPEAQGLRRRTFLRGLRARTAAWLEAHPHACETVRG